MTTSTLRALYHASSKHSGYQLLADSVAPLLPDVTPPRSRHERERLAYLLRHVDVRGAHVIDVGGNTGFFSIALLDAGAARVTHVEGNAAHHAFVREAAHVLGYGDRLDTRHEYASFTRGALPRAHGMLLLNVLHHLGDDFGSASLSREAAKARMLAPLRTLAHEYHWLAFQLGFNWKGDRHEPLFATGTKAELIEFVRSETSTDWTIDAIGIAERRADGLVFADLDEANIARNDALGEFLNRPLFILRSRHVAAGAIG
ncbi:MAG: hypothetical protein MUF00_07915 [Gemmatimonadaceae bacterium]|nr:hypothetical protein [Gemmatimonadaceae bacterium]